MIFLFLSTTKIVDHYLFINFYYLLRSSFCVRRFLNVTAYIYLTPLGEIEGGIPGENGFLSLNRFTTKIFKFVCNFNLLISSFWLRERYFVKLHDIDEELPPLSFQPFLNDLYNLSSRKVFLLRSSLWLTFQVRLYISRFLENW